MARAAASLVFAGALACGACARGRPVAAPGVVVPAAAPGFAGARRGGTPRAAQASPPRGTPQFEMPREVGCEFRAWSWARKHASLRLRPGGAPYADIFGGWATGTIVLPVGDAALGAAVDFTMAGISLRGNLDADDVPLYPATPFVVEGVVVPGGSTPFGWVAAEAGAVSLRLLPNKRVRLADAARPLRQPCRSVGVETSSFVEQEAAGAPTLNRARAAKLRPGVIVPIADGPGGATRATVERGVDDPDEVFIVASRGKASRIAWWLPDEGEGSAFVFGWVPSALVVPYRPPPVEYGVSNSLSCTPPPKTMSSCPNGNVQLIAEVEGERLVVGRLHGDTRAVVEPGGDDDELAAVKAFETGPPGQSVPLAVQPATGARILMRRADVGRCAP